MERLRDCRLDPLSSSAVAPTSLSDERDGNPRREIRGPSAGTAAADGRAGQRPTREAGNIGGKEQEARKLVDV